MHQSLRRSNKTVIGQEDYYMMTNKYEKNDFRIHEYPIFPTGVQKVLLAARFDQEDSAYNTLAGLVNQSYSQGGRSRRTEDSCPESPDPGRE